MKRIILLFFEAIFMLGFISCSSNQSCKFKTEELWDWFYMDIPENLYLDKKYYIENKMACYTEYSNPRSFLTIFMEDSVNKSILLEQVNADKEGYTKQGYYVTNYTISDSVASFKFGKGMLTGKAHYVIKDFYGIFHFVVKYVGIEGYNIDVIKHIANSIQLRAQLPDTDLSYDPTFENKYFSLTYPKAWLYMEHPDEMSDVYIGANDEQFGVIIVRFEQAMGLVEINREISDELKKLGLTVHSSRLKIAGKDGYKTISYGNLGGQNVKFIEYSFKDADMFYDLKFGGEAKSVDKYNKEMEKIVTSFKLK